MNCRTIVTCLALGSVAAPALGQENETAEELVSAFVELGTHAEWQPYRIFADCSVMSPVHSRAFDMLSSMELPYFRARQLTLAWSLSLRGCKDPRLVDWFFERIEEVIQTGGSADQLAAVWLALTEATSEDIRRRLRLYVHGTDVAHDIRVAAGHAIFDGIDGSERRTEFGSLLRSRAIPYGLAIAVGSVMVRYDAAWTLEEAARAVSEDPTIVREPLFSQIVATARQFASVGMREEFAGRLEATAVRGGVDEGEAARLREAVQRLSR